MNKQTILQAASTYYLAPGQRRPLIGPMWWLFLIVWYIWNIFRLVPTSLRWWGATVGELMSDDHKKLIQAVETQVKIDNEPTFYCHYFRCWHGVAFILLKMWQSNQFIISDRQMVSEAFPFIELWLVIIHIIGSGETHLDRDHCKPPKIVTELYCIISGVRVWQWSEKPVQYFGVLTNGQSFCACFITEAKQK
jgi:hypothetical protein